jgi:hypothetical protein
MKHFLLFIFCLNISQFTFAQISKTNIVEHFTNTNCSICANQNPGIQTTLNSYPNVLHIAFHPSAPYAACVFSMSNPIENDARTNFYNIYGGTPRLIVNGTLTTTANLNSALTALNSSTTNFSLTAKQLFITPDSVEVIVSIKKMAADTLTQAFLFAGAKEDTINQTTANGETVHHNVFRKALSVTSGDAVSLPTNINDSVTFSYSYKILPTWNPARMQTIAILQEANKQVINAAESTNTVSIPTTIKDNNLELAKIYPNPSSDIITINSTVYITDFELFSIQGTSLLKGKLANNKISVANMPNGNYILKLISNNNSIISKIQIKK